MDDDDKKRQGASQSGTDDDTDDMNEPAASSSKPKADGDEKLPRMKTPGVFITETNDRDGK